MAAVHVVVRRPEFLSTGTQRPGTDCWVEVFEKQRCRLAQGVAVCWLVYLALPELLYPPQGKQYPERCSGQPVLTHGSCITHLRETAVEGIGTTRG